MSSLNLFDDVVPLEKQHPIYIMMKKECYEPEREVINQWAKANKRAHQEVDSGRILSNFEWWLKRWPSPEQLEVVDSMKSKKN